VYPAQHRQLAHDIAANGAIVSEFPLGTTPRAELFPRRNRIISGLSLGTLIVEAALKSGSLITARMAMEQGREVFAIPGSIHNPLSRGCHQLIREGAKLVETADDIIEELSALAGVKKPLAADLTDSSVTHEKDGDYRILFEYLGYDPIPVDKLIENSGLTADAVSSMLLLLELQGEVESLPGGRYVRTGS
jgi:DNA processing protein